MKKVLHLGLVLIAAIAIATPAAAHNRIASSTPAIDLFDVAAAHKDVQPLQLFAGATILDEVARVELPAPSIADELALRFASTDVESPQELRVFDRSVSQKLASGPRRFTLQSKSSEWSDLGRKPWWGEENKAYPFRDPSTGLVYARARWYDSETGTFLTPDPESYADSSNLYAAFANDPVNNSDPTGEICERANASGGWDWAARCGQDIGWFAQAANEGIFDPRNAWKNTKRGAGGLVSTGVLVKDTVVGVATLAWDATTMSVNDAAADRMVGRGHAISRFVADPVGAIVNAHTSAADAILAAEASGSYVASGRAAASIAQHDFLAAYGVHALGRAALARMGSSVALEEGAFSSNWYARGLSELGSVYAGEVGALATTSVSAHRVALITILGENVTKRVEPFANATGNRWLGYGATPAEWEAMTPKQRWRLNDRQLRERISAGDRFEYIGQDPFRPPAIRRQFDLTGSELLRLRSRGVPYGIVPSDVVQKVIGRP